MIQQFNHLIFKSSNHLIYFCFLLLFGSCQTEIDVKVPDYYNKVVVEGYIENGEYPIVSIYRSIPYFSEMSLDYLFNTVVISNANVYVTSSKGETQELVLKYDPQAPLFYAYVGQGFKGEFNTSYTLRIEMDGKTYTSETSILNSFDLDSVFFAPTFGQAKIDTSANLRIKMTDNGQGDNFYQFKVKVHCKDFADRLWVTAVPKAFDNSPFRGQSFNYEIIRGSPSILLKEMSDQEHRSYMRRNYRIGDTVYMKYGRVDASAYRFWLTVSFGQNSFMEPEPTISNIKCNTGEKCLGVWCGSATQEMMLILDTATAKSPGAPFCIR